MKHYSVNVKTAPAAEPLTLAEAKKHLRIDSDLTDQDDLVEGLITAAREQSENFCRRSWVRRTLELRLDCFPPAILLPRSPVSSVTSITYTDQNGAAQVLAASQYQADLYATPPRIIPTFGAVWPVPKIGTLNSVVVEYVAGYAPGDTSPTDHAANVPDSVKAAMKLIIDHLYENREGSSDLPGVAKILLRPFEIRDFALEA